MLDTHTVARSLTAADFTPAQADAVTDALLLVAEHGDHVTSDQFKAGLTEMRAEQRAEIAEVRTEIANLDTRLSGQIANLDTRLSGQIANLDTRLSGQIAEVRSEIGNLEARLIKWIIGTVVATASVTVAIAGVVVGVLRLLAE